MNRLDLVKYIRLGWVTYDQITEKKKKLCQIMGQIDRKRKVLQNITFNFGFFKKGGSDFKEQLCIHAVSDYKKRSYKKQR